MSSIRSFVSVVALVFVFALVCFPVFAQQEMTDEEAFAACGACGGTFLLILVGLTALNIALLVWVARDAKARGMDSAVLWMVLVFATGLVGLLIYIFSRPQGNTVQCPHCNNKRLEASAKCPHCGNE